MDKKQIQSKFFFLIAVAISLSFIGGVFWQRYYSVHRLLVDLGIRTIEYSDRSDRIEFSKSKLKNPLIIFISGQSNVANTVAHMSHTSLPIFNFYQGKLYYAKDPLLGATGKLGSIWLDVGTHLLARDHFSEIVFINTARNNASIKNWIATGKYYHHLEDTYKELHEAKLSPHVVLFGQGERDAIDRMPFSEYSRYLDDFYRSIQYLHGNKPFLISLTSRCFVNLPNDNIRQGQKALIDNYPFVYQGPDTDKFNELYRYDGCHFNKLGSKKISALWADSIHQAINHNSKITDNGTL